MLLFADPPTAPDGRPLLPGLTAWPDHVDSRAVYYVPTALELLPAVDGDPDFFLLRYHGDLAEATGGLLRFRLGFSPLPAAVQQAATDAGFQLSQAGFEAARWRIRLRSLQEGQPDDIGDWRPLQPAARELVAPAISLSARETQFLDMLLADAHNAVEVELELRYAGLVPGLPWLVTADTAALKALLAVRLPAGPVRADQVSAAFLSLPEMGGPLSWRPLEAGAAVPTRDAVMYEVAMRALEDLFERQPPAGDDDFAMPLYSLRAAPADPSAFSWDLTSPRRAGRMGALSWSVTSLVQRLDTPEKRRKLFPSVSEVSPFAKVDVHVINRVPYDPGFVRRALVDLRYSGAAGVPEFRSFTFDGSAEAQTFSAFYPAAVADFQLAYRITTITAPPAGSGWPVVHKGEYVPATGLVVEVNRAAVGMDFVRVEAEPGVFVNAAAIAVELLPPDPGGGPPAGTTPPPLVQLRLTSARPAVWVALLGVEPAADLYVRAVAYASGDPGAPPYPLRSDRVIHRRVRIAAYQLEVLDPDRVTIQLDAQVAGHFALVRMTVAPLVGDGQTYTLQADQPVAWNCFRRSVFEALHYRYRLEYVAIDAEGHTLPAVMTEWRESQETVLTVRPPLNGPEADQ